MGYRTSHLNRGGNYDDFIQKDPFDHYMAEQEKTTFNIQFRFFSQKKLGDIWILHAAPDE
jgi:hypothetical protein